ncbi:hypothetical protein NPIL_25191 [Nephila pilipes]|uniref:Uncharacterized protein n=1 Tax=Nephila pilipes TaxID=299642 RepID=A0A8X6QLS6_NEPPI|nr:hypothetical protein NPIL_107691 [Nephila pilipes]GFU20434.1 hypothetical protein NPIL_25191 [Nephila pilipes]
MRIDFSLLFSSPRACPVDAAIKAIRSQWTLAQSTEDPSPQRKRRPSPLCGCERGADKLCPKKQPMEFRSGPRGYLNRGHFEWVRELSYRLRSGNRSSSTETVIR